MVLALTSALALASCGKKIGDACQTTTDCDPNGARICDLAQPGGYCTILGCDDTTCPSEAACIRYFPVQFLTTPCNPYCEDRQGLPVPPAGSDAGMSTTAAMSTDAGVSTDAAMSTDAGVSTIPGTRIDAAPLPVCPDLFPQNAASQADALAVCPNGATNDCTADEICLDVGLCAPRSTEVRYCARTCSSNGDCRAGYVCRPTGTEGSVLLSSTPCGQTAFCAPQDQQ
jgi:hypothetical protein